LKENGDEENLGETTRSELKLSKIHFVDLAGSERVLPDNTQQPLVFFETQNIHVSLSSFGFFYFFFSF
jgi:hypothetical protein